MYITRSSVQSCIARTGRVFNLTHCTWARVYIVNCTILCIQTRLRTEKLSPRELKTDYSRATVGGRGGRKGEGVEGGMGLMRRGEMTEARGRS